MEEKNVNESPEKALPELVECENRSRFNEVCDFVKSAIQKIGTRNLVVVASLVLIGTAVILNFVMFGNSDPIVTEGDILGTGLDAYEEETPVDNTYFASAQLSRKQARDQALAVLQTVVDSTSADAVSREQASTDISRIASEIQSEANIETLIKSKGFEDCVAVIADGNASVIVRSDGLLPNELSQIKEIVYEQAGIDPVSIKIIEQSET